MAIKESGYSTIPFINGPMDGANLSSLGGFVDPGPKASVRQMIPDMWPEEMLFKINGVLYHYAHCEDCPMGQGTPFRREDDAYVYVE